MEYDLTRFITAQQTDYNTALSEIKNGKKVSHWMWYIFPQLKGLGRSFTSEYFGINDLEEAKAFLENPYLGSNLKEISSVLLKLKCNDASLIFGHIDSLKLKSSMTLFSLAEPNEPIFRKVLEKYFNGATDNTTIRLLNM